MPKRNLLLCFDAFGTLFTPTRPIATQYGEVARSLGLGGFTDEQVHDSFKKAYKLSAKQYPNFGKADGMNAEGWWTDIIHNTFRPLVGAEQLHEELAPRLLYRFHSEEGYKLMPGVTSLLRGLRSRYQDHESRTVVGVVTNSDERVPDILTSFGLKVSPLKFGTKPMGSNTPGEQHDVDFSVMSYDVGHEKPDKRIFDAAEGMLKSLPGAGDSDLNAWDKVYIGDEYEKDVVGARDAGWYAVLINRDAAGTPDDVENLDEASPGDLLQYLEGHPAVAFSGLERLAPWLGIHIPH
ncbi:hypothetical protein LTR36_000732 [Oleoguttula mirabilis]|uniref:Haloacid dehalogenase n=1 Tax=Oleoguttula mirabilis TaxID=1507867 RepID=A0AAV9JS10_9PEZI|nr:hypothetical protein LTR36_000732 [Oleoguttula mirabilis]